MPTVKSIDRTRVIHDLQKKGEKEAIQLINAQKRSYDNLERMFNDLMVKYKIALKANNWVV